MRTDKLKQGIVTRNRVAGYFATLVAIAAIMAGTAQAQTVTQYSAGITGNSSPAGIATDGSGSMWFTELNTGRIGRITASGVVNEFTVPSAGGTPVRIAAGAVDGNMWFTEYNGNIIGRITPSGVVTEFTVPTSHAGVYGIAAGSDGNMWFCEQAVNKIGKITPTGTITEYSSGLTAGSGPFSIIGGVDGNMWFTEAFGGRIGRITPAGVVTEFTAGLTANSGPGAIILGPDDNLWFTENTANKIGRITTAGVITEFSSGISANAGLGAIAVGGDGALWFLEGATGKLGRITTAGQVSEIAASSTANDLAWLAESTDGSLWITLNKSSALAHVTNLAAPTDALTVTVSGSGTVTSSPSGISCPGACSALYGMSTTVTLTATPGSGAKFNGWSGACSNTSGTCAVILSSPQSVTATFSASTVIANPGPTVSGGRFHSLALAADGTVRAWGDDTLGELGDGAASGNTATSTVPIQVSGLSGIVALSASNQFSVALKNDGTVLAWGNNSNSQLGDGTQTNRSTPITVGGIANVTAISAGFLHTTVLKSDGTVWAWGSNASGQIGNGGTTSQTTPVQVMNLSGVKAIAAGQVHTLALKSDGTVWAWGANAAGELGDGTTTSHSTPAQVPGLSNVIAIAAKATHSAALTGDGNVWTWGDNSNGQIGDGTTTNRLSPYMVSGIVSGAFNASGGATTISAGSQFMLALRADGSVLAWGQNDSGQLGDGTTTQHLTPVTIPRLTSPASLAAGATHSLALKSDGTVLAWGSNGFGQLGDGTLAARSSPVVPLHEGGTGNLASNNWYLDLNAGISKTIATSLTPPFLAATTGAVQTTSATVSAAIQFNPADLSKSGALYITALAPPGSLPGSTAASANGAVLYSLTNLGFWAAVTNGQLLAYSTTVNSNLSQQIISVLSSAAVATIPGAQFCMGYSAGGSGAIQSRVIATVPGTFASGSTTTCLSAASAVVPQAGYWWNPAEGGRGFTIEQGATGNVFVATYLYDTNGNPVWYAAGPSPMNGSTFTGPLLAYANGQTLSGTFKPATSSASPGNVTIVFTDASHASLTWPGSTIPVQRYEFLTGGLSSPPTATQPQSGYWWNPAEGGRGYTVEVQNSTAFIAAYMYDASGNPVWYASGPIALSGSTYSGVLSLYSGGETLTGSYKPVTNVASVGSITIQFTSSTTATLTLPNGTQIPIQRYPF